MMLILLANRFRTFISDLRHHKRKAVLAAVAFGILPVWVFLQSYHLFHSWTASGSPPPFLYHFILKTVWGLFIFFIFSSISLTMHFNYLSKEIELLLTLPFSIHTLFAYQFLNTVFANTPLFAGLGLSFILALGIAFDVSFLYYPYLLLLSAGFLVITTALATIMSLFLVRLLSAKILRTITSLIVSIFFIAVWAGLQVAGGGPYQPDMDNTAVNTVLESSAVVPGTSFTLSPVSWFARAIYGFITAEIKPVLMSSLFFIAAALLLFVVTLKILQHSFNSGYDSTHPLDESLRPRMQKNAGRAKRRSFFSFSLSSVLVKQNILLIIRDSRHLLQLILFCSMLIVIPFVRVRDSSVYMVPWDFTSPFALMLYFLAFLTSMNTARSIPVERLSYGYIRTTPVPVHYFLMAKMATSCFFSFLAVILTLTIFYIKFSIPFGRMMLLLKTSMIYILGAAGIGISIGAWFSKFNWEHPKQMLQTGGSVVSAFACFIYWLVTLGVLTFWEEKKLDMGFFIILLISLGLIITGTASARYTLERKDWLY